ncbi:hypothetical protein [Micromonospora arborensis]|uniref:hypothetical protein n=1 Tax=Micromonospora arborensis TaxID=2116518 RepID=UPI003711279B
MSAPTAPPALPSMSAQEWNDARTVHEIVVRQNSTLPCFHCKKQLLQHSGPARVVPNEEDPEQPKVFGSTACESAWRQWQGRKALLPQSYDVSGWTSVPVTVVDGVEYIAGDAPKSTLVGR